MGSVLEFVFAPVRARSCRLAVSVVFAAVVVAVLVGMAGAASERVAGVRVAATGAHSLALSGDPGELGRVALMRQSGFELQPRVARRLATTNGTIAADGNPVEVDVTSAGDTGTLTFTGTAGERIFLTTVFGSLTGTGSLYGSLALVGPDGTTLRSNNYNCSGCTAFIDTMALPTDGTYTLKVNLSPATTGSATLTLYNVPADVASSIAADGNPVSLSNSTPGQDGSLSFAGTTGERVFLKAAYGTFSGAGLRAASVALVAPDGTTVGADNYECSGCTGFIDTKTLPANGTYTLKVNFSDATIGTGTYTLWSVPADITGSISEGGSSVAVTSSTPGRDGSLTFAGTAGDRVFLKAATGALTGSSLPASTVSIVKPDGNSWGTHLITSNSTGFIDTVTLPVSGTYTVKVDFYNDTTGTTTLTLSAVPPDDSGSMTLGGPSSTVTIGTPGQNGRRTFAGLQAQPVTISFTNPSSGALSIWTTVSIRKPDGSTLMSAYLANGSTMNATLPTDGTYTIYVDPPDDNTGSLTLGLNQHGSFVPVTQTYGCGGSAYFGPDNSPCLADPVDTLTGSFNEQLTDVALPGIGYPFSFGRSYSSADLSSGRMGIGWHDSLSANLQILDSGNVVLHGENGQQITYSKNSDGSFTAATASATLKSVQSGYELVRRDQIHYLFDTSGRLLSIKDRNGEGLTLSYSGAQLTTVTDAGGRQATVPTPPTD